MGRYYGGDIEGKFWFGVQSSNDADHFGCVGRYESQWRCTECGDTCCIEEDIDSYDVNGCSETDSKEHHWVIEACETMLEYYFNEEHIPIIKYQLKRYTNQLKQMLNCTDRSFRYLMKSISKDDNDLYDMIEKYNAIDDIKEVYEIAARLILGYQIYNCIKENGGCSFWAEC